MSAQPPPPPQKAERRTAPVSSVKATPLSNKPAAPPAQGGQSGQSAPSKSAAPAGRGGQPGQPAPSKPAAAPGHGGQHGQPAPGKPAAMTGQVQPRPPAQRNESTVAIREGQSRPPAQRMASTDSPNSRPHPSTPAPASQGQGTNNDKATEKGFLPYVPRPGDVANKLSRHIAEFRKLSPESVFKTYQGLEQGFHLVFTRELCVKHDDLGPDDHPNKRALRFNEHERLVAAVASTEEALKVLGRLLEKGRSVVVHAARDAKKAERPHATKPLVINVSHMVEHEAKQSHKKDIELKVSPSGLDATANWKDPLRINLQSLKEITSLANLTTVKKLGLNRPIEQCSFLGGGGGSDVIQAAFVAKLLMKANKDIKARSLISIRNGFSKSTGFGEERSVWDKNDPTKKNLLKASGGNLQILPGHCGNARFVEDAPIHEREFPNVRLVTDDKGLIALRKPRYEKAIGENADTIIVIDTGGDVLCGMGPEAKKKAPDQDCRTQATTWRISQSKGLNALVAIAAVGVDSPSYAEDKLSRSGAVYYRFTDGDKEFLRRLYQKWHFDGSLASLKKYPEHYGKTPFAMLASFELKPNDIGVWKALPLPESCITDWGNPWACITWVTPVMSYLVLANQEELCKQLHIREIE